MRSVFDEAKRGAEATGDEIFANPSFKNLSDDIIGLLPNPDYNYSTIDNILKAVTEYQRTKSLLLKTAHSPDRRHGAGYPGYDTLNHQTLLRYGNVELRAAENFLIRRDEQLAALEQLLPHLEDEERIYSPSRASGYLVADDCEWNLRRLMTNAGFYVENNIESALKCLEEWSTRYLRALRNAHLVWHNNFLPYFLKIELSNYQTHKVTPEYVSAPNIFQIYNTFELNEVVFVSPLSELIQQQADTGRLFRLYSGYDVPKFSLRAIPAWVSTWPNRPHSCWRETFSGLCEAVRMAHRERPFTVFASACGSYGLPLCDFVRQEYGCKVLYLGNFIHVAFGIRQRTTRNFMSGRINAEMWVDSDLAKYSNMSRIDNGRYLS